MQESAIVHRDVIDPYLAMRIVGRWRELAEALPAELASLLSQSSPIALDDAAPPDDLDDLLRRAKESSGNGETLAHILSRLNCSPAAACARPVDARVKARRLLWTVVAHRIWRRAVAVPRRESLPDVPAGDSLLAYCREIRSACEARAQVSFLGLLVADPWEQEFLGDVSDFIDVVESRLASSELREKPVARQNSPEAMLGSVVAAIDEKLAGDPQVFWLQQIVDGWPESRLPIALKMVAADPRPSDELKWEPDERIETRLAGELGVLLANVYDIHATDDEWRALQARLAAASPLGSGGKRVKIEFVRHFDADERQHDRFEVIPDFARPAPKVDRTCVLIGDSDDVVVRHGLVLEGRLSKSLQPAGEALIALHGQLAMVRDPNRPLMTDIQDFWKRLATKKEQWKKFRDEQEALEVCWLIQRIWLYASAPEPGPLKDAAEAALVRFTSCLKIELVDHANPRGELFAPKHTESLQTLIGLPLRTGLAVKLPDREPVHPPLWWRLRGSPALRGRLAQLMSEVDDTTRADRAAGAWREEYEGALMALCRDRGTRERTEPVLSLLTTWYRRESAERADRETRNRYHKLFTALLELLTHDEGIEVFPRVKLDGDKIVLQPARQEDLPLHPRYQLARSEKSLQVVNFAAFVDAKSTSDSSWTLGIGAMDLAEAEHWRSLGAPPTVNGVEPSVELRQAADGVLFSILRSGSVQSIKSGLREAASQDSASAWLDAMTRAAILDRDPTCRHWLDVLLSTGMRLYPSPNGDTFHWPPGTPLKGCKGVKGRCDEQTPVGYVILRGGGGARAAGSLQVAARPQAAVCTLSMGSATDQGWLGASHRVKEWVKRRKVLEADAIVPRMSRLDETTFRMQLQADDKSPLNIARDLLEELNLIWSNLSSGQNYLGLKSGSDGESLEALGELLAELRIWFDKHGITITPAAWRFGATMKRSLLTPEELAGAEFAFRAEGGEDEAVVTAFGLALSKPGEACVPCRIQVSCGKQPEGYDHLLELLDNARSPEAAKVIGLLRELPMVALNPEKKEDRLKSIFRYYFDQLASKWRREFHDLAVEFERGFELLLRKFGGLYLKHPPERWNRTLCDWVQVGLSDSEPMPDTAIQEIRPALFRDKHLLVKADVRLVMHR